MFKLMGKEINAILGAQTILTWTYDFSRSAAESESEDIVTEEIPIDTSQAMDVIASSSSARVSIIDSEVEVQVDESQAHQETEILSDCGNEFDPVKAYKDCVTIENEKPSIIPVSKPSISSKVEAVKSKIIVYDPMNEDNSSGSVKSVLLERESKKKQVHTIKGRVLELDASSHQRMSNVCTGQVVHVPTIKSRKLISPKVIEVSEMTEGSIEEKGDPSLIESETLDTVRKNPLLQPGDRDKQVENEEQVTSINDNDQNVVCDVDKRVFSMEDRAFHNPLSGDKPALTHMRSVSTNQVTDDVGKSTTLSSAQNNDTNVTLGLSVVVSTENSTSIQSIKTDKTDIHKGNVLTTRDNSMKEEDKTTDLEEATVTVMTESDQLISETEVPETGMHSRIEMVQTGTIYSDIGLGDSEDMEVVNATVDSENPEFIALPIVEEPYTEEVMDKELFVDKDLETVNINKDLETDNSIRESKTVQNNKEVQNSKVALHNAFVEIIEYGRLKKQIPVPHKMTESGFDYIMFGENLVQIRRPQKLHGRIQPVKEVDADSNLSNAGPLEYVVIQPPKEKTNAGKHRSSLTLNVPIATKVICFFCLLKCLRSLYGKLCGPMSYCFYRSSLFWVHVVCFFTWFVSNARQLFAADAFSRRHFQIHFFLSALRVNRQIFLV